MFLRNRGGELLKCCPSLSELTVSTYEFSGDVSLMLGVGNRMWGEELWRRHS
jgi:hypothetical protein